MTPTPKSYRKSKAILLTVLICSGAEATLENTSFSDTRAASLGGAISASVDDASAGLINAAALGFMARPSSAELDNNGLGGKKFGWTLIDLGASASLTGDLGDYLETLGKIDFNNFDTDQLKQPENVGNLLGLASVLGNVGDQDTILVSASAGTAVQMGQFSIGARAFGQVGGWINNLDVARLGLGYAISDLTDDLRDALGSEGFVPGGYVSESLTGDQQQKLRDAFDVDLDEDVIKYIDFKVTELVDSGTISAEQIQGAIDSLSSIIEASGGAGGLLSENQTSITGRGFGAIEVPISYGYALDDNLSLGVTTKFLFGRVYGTQVWAFNDSNTEIIQDTLDSSNDSVALGLDLSALYRIPKWQFALVGHNLNSPKFDGYNQTVTLDTPGGPVTETVHVPGVKLDPQITIGAAWYPVKRFMLASDYELLETGTLLNGYDIQRLSFGTELDLTLVALRLGTYKNMAESDYGWVLTGGVGFNLWALSVDVGAAISINDTVEYEGTEYPRTARLHAGIGLVF